MVTLGSSNRKRDREYCGNLTKIHLHFINNSFSRLGEVKKRGIYICCLRCPQQRQQCISLCDLIGLLYDEL